MFRKSYYTMLFVAALFLIGNTVVYAQTQPVRGKVVVKKADGTTVPVEDALVEAYRTDIAGKIPSAKTNKKGEFSFAGFPAGAKAALVVSAVGIRSDIYPDIKGGDENITLTMSEGDGKPLTEAEVRKLLTDIPKDAKPVKLTEAQLKEQAELEKKNAEIMASNKKAENANAIVNKSQTEGNKAFNEKNYDLAITNYQAGIDADPDFEGSAPVLLNNKALALIKRSITNYNAAVKGDPSGKAAALDAVKKDLNEAVAASDKSLQILKTATNADPKIQKAYTLEKIKAYQNSIEGYSKMFAMKLDFTKGKESVAALDGYSVIETDTVKKNQWQIVLANALSEGGDLDNAAIIFRRVLETSPDNADALGGLGLVLVGLGSATTPADKGMMQEGLNLLQRFTEVAPDTHPLKNSVKETAEYLKSEQMTPQKTTKPGKKKT